MILTKTQVKTYLGITSTDYDNQIDAMIDPILYDMFDYTSNHFHNNAVKIRTQQMTFSTTGTIVVSGTNFSTYSFASGDEIHIENSARNDGFYTASSVSSATITVSTTQTLKSETWEAPVTITKVDVPISLLPVMSAMIKYKIDTPMGNPLSESLGDYSVTYGGNDYPASIEKSLNKYRLVKFV